MKVLLTGATGYIGRRLKERLLEDKSLQVRLFVRNERSETIIQNDNAKRYFPHISPLSYDDAVKTALAEIEKKQIISRWCDSSAKEACDIKDQDRIATAVFAGKKAYKNV